MKIQNKLFLFLFSFSLVLVTVLVVLMQWSIGKGMVEYVLSKEIETLKPVIAKLSKEYQEKKNWRFIQGNHSKFGRLISQQIDGTDFEPPQRVGPPKNRRIKDPNRLPPHLSKSKLPPHERDTGSKPSRMREPNMRPPPTPEGEAQYAILDMDENLVVGLYDESLDYVKMPINVGSTTVGYFAVSKRNQLTQGYEVDFIQQQQHYLLYIALFVMLLVTLVTFPLARHIVEPIKLITRGMHKLTQGDYQQSINLNRKDELYKLSRDYNELALTLAENESARKRWLADISHELRTPVAILRGELEAMLDEVRPLTTENIASANDEVKHLQRLIDDLNILTSTDIGGMNYRKQHEDLIELIQSEERKYTDYLADAGITLSFDLTSQEANIYVDQNRLIQLFENILNNSIKYSAATQFKVSVTIDKETHGSSEKSEPCAIITFEDNGVGVDESHLPHLFEHLYRVENSRNRKTGGSGLGLSICRHIITAHQGEIIAQKSGLGGLAVIVTLPLVP